MFGRRFGFDRLTGFGVVGSVVSLLFCGTMLTPFLAAALVAVGLGALAPKVETLVLAALALFVALAVFGWWRRRRRGAMAHAAAPVAEPVGTSG